MKLEGHVLSNHHAPDDPPTWQISVKDATVTANPRKRRFVLELYNAKMELICDSKEECDRWVAAISSGKETSHKGDGGGAGDYDNKENKAATSQSPATVLPSIIGQPNRNEPKLATDEDPTGKKKALDNLSKSFKVVKPPPKPSETNSADIKSSEPLESKALKVVKPIRRSGKDIADDVGSIDSEMDEEFAADANVEEEDAHQPKNGKGRIYDDTPNSMIFKQFAFKS
jgi:hypothetical protein